MMAHSLTATTAAGDSPLTPRWRSGLRLQSLLPGGYPAVLIAGCALTIAAVLALDPPAAVPATDADLARLLRGMALIKAALVLPVLALLSWRLRRPLSPRLAVAYMVAASACCAATAMIWQLSHIAAAAGLFHLGALALLVLAWRDDMPRVRWVARRTSTRARGTQPAP